MKRALVSGASSGIGEAFVERLTGDGWDVVAVARRRDRLEALATRLGAAGGGRVQVVQADLGTAEGVDAVRDAVSEAPLELLVNNAALAHYMPFAELPPASARELVDVNVLAPVLLIRAALPQMLAQKAGAIVNVASLLAFSGEWAAPQLPERAVYAGTKSFLVTYTQVLAQELAGTGVRAQVLCPGVFGASSTRDRAWT